MNTSEREEEDKGKTREDEEVERRGKRVCEYRKDPREGRRG